VTRRWLLAAVAAVGGACGDTTSTGVLELNLDRPVDIAFACYGEMKLSNGQITSSNTAMPTAICQALSPQVTPLDPTGAGTVRSLGFNLHSPDFGNALFNQPTDRTSYPILGPLQNNGGPTLTHSPLPGSPAIDQGFNLSGAATDQRGGARTADYSGIPNASGGDGTDIGAVEVQ